MSPSEEASTIDQAEDGISAFRSRSQISIGKGLLQRI